MKVEAVPECLELMDGWVRQLAEVLPDPIQVPVPGHDFRWKYPIDTPEVVLVVKCVRLTTSLAGAWHLANVGLTTESGGLCRQIDDFSSEVWFVAESMLNGTQTAGQRKFIEDFFQPPAASVDEYLSRERQRYVSRSEIGKAAERLSREAGQDADEFRRVSSYITYGLNKYTHGSYESAMEIYHGGFKKFMVLGADGRPRDAAVRFVGLKATEACYAVAAAANALSRNDVFAEIRAFVEKVDPTVQRLRGGQ